jgi:hypothetical protein
MHRTILTICGCATLATALTPQIALADAEESSEALAEVTVTAEKQVQNLQKTAAAVTAVSRARAHGGQRRRDCHDEADCHGGRQARHPLQHAVGGLPGL